MWLPGRLSLAKFKPVNCTILPVIPFLSNGKKHLTPPNAIDHVLTGIGSNELIFTFMITATTENKFIDSLQVLANAWSMPDFEKALRISKALSTLDTNKMIIPAIDKSTISTPISSSQTRLIESSQKAGKIQPLSLDSIQKSLNSFTVKQQHILDALNSQAKQAGNEKIDIYYYFGLANELKKDVPNQNHIFTLLVGFTGAECINMIDLIELP